MKTFILPRILATLGLAVFAVAFPAESNAVQLTYDVRVVGSSNPTATDYSNPHEVRILFAAPGFTPGIVLTLQIYAIVNSADNNHANDGFLRGSGSLLSSGNLRGTLRGDTFGGGTTLQNNVPLFSGSGAQSGSQTDLDGDGDFDLGSFSQSGSPSASPWFVAMGAGQQTQFGTGMSAGATEFLIGQTTFTMSNNPIIYDATSLNFIPQVRTDGTPADQLLHEFTIDGVPTALAGNDPNVAFIGANVGLTDTPEPSASMMMLCGAVTLAGFRRRR